MKKLPFVLLFALLICVFTFSVSASYFRDVTDVNTASAVEQLRLLGVIDGMGNGLFEPSGTLTRAQFCKMAVTALRESSNVSQYKNYTIFPDVRQNHWATGYINYSVRSDKKFISGFPDGTFKPDNPITYGQAVTILMRLLGYSDSDVGMVWPDGYINAAKNNGLTDGVVSYGSSSINRAQAAKLFANMLITNTKDGKNFISTISGSVMENVILLSNNVRSSDGFSNGLLTTTGTFKTSEKTASADLLGEKGFLALDEKGIVLTFIPDKNAVSKRITVSSVSNGYVIDEGGIKQIIGSSTKTYSSGEETTWGKASASVKKGSVITVYYGSSGVGEYVFVGGGYDKKTVVVSANGSLREISTIVNQPGYNLYRNGNKALSSELCKYDVASYDEVNNKVDVSNVRITAAYEDAYPDFTRPEKITLLGTDFDVLPQALNDILNFKAGDKVTVLLNADGKIASVLNPSVLSGNARGIVTSVTGTKATVELTCGIVVSGNPHLGSSVISDYAGHLVTVSSAKTGDILLGIISKTSNYGDWLVEQSVMGSLNVSDSVTVYEYIEGSLLKSVDKNDLPSSVSANKIVYVEIENGKVTLVILNDVTGSAYSYGIAKYESVKSEEDAYSTISVETASGTVGPVICRGIFKTGEWVGIALSADNRYETNTVRLTLIRNVLMSGIKNGTLTLSGETYKIDDNVQCYNDTLKKWIDYAAASRLSETCDIYVYNGFVRALIIR